MSFFRRLFSSQSLPKPGDPPASPAKSTGELVPITPTQPSAAVQPPTPPTEPMQRPTGEPEQRPLNGFSTGSLVDGVTRPLPQDALIDLTGNEHLAFGQATDVGMVRTNNQDSAFSFFSAARSAFERPDFGLFVVADGMGGHHDGEKASALAARSVGTHLLTKIGMPLLIGDDHFNDVPITEAMNDAILKANNEVVQKVPDGGTTCTAVTVIGDMAYIAHVGDSRVYFIQREKIERLTRDHSLVERLIELEQLTREEAEDHPQKNVLYRALGQNEDIEVDTLTRRLPPRSRILICSDGLWNQVDDTKIRDVINLYPNPQEACSELVKLANNSGGLDNVTVILLQLPG